MSTRTVSARTTVDAPPHVVFAIVADPRQHARIDGSGSVQDLIEGPDRLSQGAEFGVRMKMFGLPYKIANTVVEFEEDRLIAWRHFGGHRWRYELEPTDDGGTVVTETFDYSRYNALWRGGDHRARLPRPQPARHRGHPGPAPRGRRGRRGAFLMAG